MSEKMLKFVDIGQQNPPKRDISDRKEDFDEIYKEFLKDRAVQQSSSVPNVEYHFAKFIVH